MNLIGTNFVRLSLIVISTRCSCVNLMLFIRVVWLSSILSSLSSFLMQFPSTIHTTMIHTSWFVSWEALKEEFRTAISLHQPKDIQTASTLALMQEEEPAHSSQRALPRDSGKFSFRSMTQFDKSKTSTSDKSKKSVAVHPSWTGQLLMIS